MATRVSSNQRSFEAGADLSNSQYHIVQIDENGNVVLTAEATDFSIGVLENAPTEGDTADVTLRNANGTAKVVAGDTVEVGDAITSDADGKAVATTTGSDEVVGYALQDGAADEVIEFMPAVTTV